MGLKRRPQDRGAAIDADVDALEWSKAHQHLYSVEGCLWAAVHAYREIPGVGLATTSRDVDLVPARVQEVRRDDLCRVSPNLPRDITRFARNPRITRVCADLRFGQELGEGIRRIFEEMHLAGLSDPVYTQTAGSVRPQLSYRPADRELEQRLPTGARDALRAINEAGRLSTGDMMRITRQARPTVLRHLRALETEGLIEWLGQSANDPRAYWTRRVE